jgi:lantibiotic modifying enzyme
LAARTIPLFQKLSDDRLLPDIECSDSAVADARLRAWCRAVAGGDEELFERRLSWDNLTRESVRPHLVDVACTPGAKPPAWVETLTRAILFAEGDRASTSRVSSRPAVSGDALPFQEVLEPYVRWARREIDGRLKGLKLDAPGALRFSDKAWRALERSLLAQMSELLSPALYAEFERGRPVGRSLLERFLAGEQPEGERPTFYYQTFTAELRGQGILRFLERYPVLARLLAQTLEAWCDSTVELIERLQADLALIQTHFQWARRPASVEEIEAALSDPHHGGRLVSVLTFDSGARLVYKPRSLQLDAAFGEFLNWCNDHAGVAFRPHDQAEPVTFHVIRQLDRGSHGWAEFVAPAPCSDRASVARFYFGAGMLLCVLHLLGATDCHYENLVAHGERLVLIDAETILQPRMRDAAEDEASGTQGARSWDTVVRTGLLPQWDFSADGRLAIDSSGLGSFAWLQGQEMMPHWKHVNTDDMTRSSTNWTPSARNNLPTLDGEPVRPGDFLEQLVEGFERAYRFFNERRESLLAAATAALRSPPPDSPLFPDSTPDTGAFHQPPIAAFAAAKARYVARATQNYFALIRTARQPENLRSGTDRAILFDSLSRPFLTTAECPDLWPIRHSEWRALERLDVPYFLVPTTGACLLPGDGQPIPVPLLTPAFTDLCERLKNWDEIGLRQQVAIIRGVFLARMAGESSTADERKPLPRAVAVASVAAHRERLMEAAGRVGHELEAAALPGHDGSVYWLTLLYHSEADRYRLEPADYDLYEGTTGIVLFLATLDAVRGKRQYRSLILSALQPLRRVLQTPAAARRFADHIGIGAASGLGSVVYALTRLADLLGAEELLDDARRAASLVDDEKIAQDTWLDLIAGSAGAILGLLALHRRAGDAALLAQAATCGEHLIQQRVGAPGLRAWRTFAERPLTGMAHGAAGIALALLRLHAATGDARFRDAAHEAMRYERSVFDEEARNWPDYRAAKTGTEGDFGCSSMWCHGAPGIGLARLGGMALDDDPKCPAEIEAALEATTRFGLSGPDYLCCGNLGRADLLLEAGLRLNRAALGRRALSMASTIVERAESEGGFRLIDDLPAGSYKPGFFRGVAGIGYELLRIAFPRRVPSILLWE